MKGRKRKPSQLKVLQGNPGRRPLNDAEPQPPPEIPAAPEFLHPAALAEWNRLAPLLFGLGLLSQIDRPALSCLCQSWALLLAVSEAIEKTPLFSASRKDERARVLQLLRIQRQASDQLRSWASEFGMTPASRTRVSVDKKPLAADNPFTKFGANHPGAKR